MKTLDNYMLKEIAGNFVVIPVGQNIVDYKGMLHLNETGAFIWKMLEEGTTYDALLNSLITEYEVNDDEVSIIKTDLDEFLTHMRSLNLLAE